jgi:Kyakuja-Dileera-Zisupton transposase
MLGSKACDVTGIVAIACARHGCFAPNSIADLFKGEQQKNIDWVLLQALKSTHMDPEQNAMLIYDIACQYFIHIQDRIGHLLPSGLELDRAIGLFHVHGHKDECFFRYATTFIPGTGVTVGEILEMLWSSLNAITSTVRTATLANCAETIDDHATDSNHKKMLNIGKYLWQCYGASAYSIKLAASLASRHLQASTMSLEASNYFSNLTVSAPIQLCRQWEKEIQDAKGRWLAEPAAMDILGTCDAHCNNILIPGNEKEVHTPAEKWIQMAIDIEERQWVTFISSNY